MNLVLKRGISSWEHSGQGDGGYTGDDDDGGDDGSINNNNNDGNEDYDIKDAKGETNRFGALAGRFQHALDLHHCFLMIGTPILFYLWDVLDEHDLVQSTMQQLLDGVGSGNGNSGVPSVIGGKCQSDDDYSLSLSKKQDKC